MLEPHILNVSSTEALQQGMAKVPDHVSAEKVLEWLICLVLWNMAFMAFHIYIYIIFFWGNFIIPTDFKSIIFQRGWVETTNQ